MAANDAVCRRWPGIDGNDWGSCKVVEGVRVGVESVPDGEVGDAGRDGTVAASLLTAWDVAVGVCSRSSSRSKIPVDISPHGQILELYYLIQQDIKMMYAVWVTLPARGTAKTC